MDRNKAQQFMLKVVGDAGTALAAALIVIGDRAGLFRHMAGAGPMTSEMLTERCGLHARYVEEWLAAMVCAGYVSYDPAREAYELPPEHALYLADPSSEYYLAGLFKGLPQLMAAVPQIAEAFEQGKGVPFADYGAHLPVALEHMNRSVYEHRLVKAWLPAMPQVVRRLEEGGSAIDVGCGTGIVPILLARAFPRARIAGLDLDAHSIEIAKANAREAGLEDRVRFIHASAEDLPIERPWDFISTFDCIHDLPDPAAALRRMRVALAPEGTVLMVEPKAADRLEDNAHSPFARMLYGISCLHCVPQSLAQGGRGLGACWGEARARDMADDAGFGHFSTLPIRSPAQSFYELRA